MPSRYSGVFYGESKQLVSCQVSYVTMNSVESVVVKLSTISVMNRNTHVYRTAAYSIMLLHPVPQSRYGLDVALFGVAHATSHPRAISHDLYAISF